jgi:hypothetical protein
MARTKARFVFRTVDIGRNDTWDIGSERASQIVIKQGEERLTIKISPANHEAEGNTSLVDTLDIVCCPADGIRNTRIDPHRA